MTQQASAQAHAPDLALSRNVLALTPLVHASYVRPLCLGTLLSRRCRDPNDPLRSQFSTVTSMGSQYSTLGLLNGHPRPGLYPGEPSNGLDHKPLEPKHLQAPDSPGSPAVRTQLPLQDGMTVVTVAGGPGGRPSQEGMLGGVDRR